MSPAEQQMMALQGVPQQQGVAVGACGPMAYNPAVAQQMAMYGEGGIPPNGMANGYGCGPIPVQSTVQDCAVWTECYTPMGVAFAVDVSGNIYPITAAGGAPGSAPSSDTFALFTRNGIMPIFGFKCFGGPNQVVFTSVSSADSDTNYLQSETDCATWNTTDCFCRVDWGCVSITNPIRIQARSIGDPSLIVAVRGTLWGTRASSLNSCGPVNVCGPGGYGGYPMGAPVPGVLPAG